MKTIDSSTLGILMANREPLDLIDIRSRAEFDAMHILGARSVPLAELDAPRPLLHREPAIEPVYVISHDRVSGSLATGILRSSGCLNATVVDGGMKAWVAQGLPVSRKIVFYNLPNLLSAGAVLLGTVGIAFAFAKFFLLAPIFIFVAALLFRANLMARAPARETERLTVPKSDPAQWHALDETNAVPAC